MFPAITIFKYFTMLKNISNLGKTLSREEQKTFIGGGKRCTVEQEAAGCVQTIHGCLCPF